MPFGLVNAPGTFQRVMESCLEDLHLVEILIYLDDILVFSPLFDEQISRLDKVFAKLDEFGLKVKGKQSFLFQDRIHYLGHVVDASGIRVDESKIVQIQNWPIPQNADQLRSFLGLAGY